MQTKIAPRIISLLLVLVTIFTLLPTTAFAANFDPVDATQAAGGSGSTPGNPKPGGNSGIWSERFQGFRITVVDYSGEPAFTFMGKNYMDLLFSTDRIDQMDYSGDGHKIGYYRSTVDSKSKLNTAILTIGDVRARLDDSRWKTAVPNADELKKAIKKMSTGVIPFPLELKGTNWVRNGTAVKNIFYGAGSKLDSTALLYTIMNLHTPAQNGWMWQPKSDANLGNSPITVEEMSWLKSGIGPDGKAYTPIQLMSDKGLVISVEPIIWNNLRESKSKFTYGVYGTQTAIGGICEWLEDGGWFKPVDNWAKGYGGYDKSLFGGSGRRSMVVDNTNIFFFSYKDSKGVPIPLEWSIDKPVDTDQISDKMVYNRQPGWSLHLYLLGTQKPQEPSTHIFDTPQGYNPHPAPDPKDIPVQNGEDISKTRIYNIVKTYRDREDGTAIHIETTKRTNNPSSILIEDEPQYKVKEWFISTVYNDPTPSTTWEDNHSQAPVTGESSTTPKQVKVEKPNTTLYVLLEKSNETLPASGNLVIKESQVTKAVETVNSSIPNWGPKTMSFSAPDISGSCPEIEYCSDDDCGGHSCGAPYIMNDTSWNYNHKNSTPIDNKIHADVGNFKAINGRGADATGNRGSVSTYNNSVDSFNYKLVVWRGKDIPTTAAYKEKSGHELNALTSRYGKTPQGERYNGKQYTEILKITLDKDGGLGDYITTSVTDHGHSKSATHSNINTLNYDATVKVEVYWGKAHQRGDLTATGSQPIQTSLIGKPSQPKYSSGQMKQSNKDVTWYPYIRMTYQTTGKADSDRTNVNILSQWLSEITPNDYVEAAWVSDADYNMNIRSAQWSLHNRATSGDKGWNYPNQVLPGGAIYNLDTKNNKTWASIVTWQPYLEEEVRTKVVIEGTEFTYDATKAPHEAFVEEAKKALEDWRVVQYVKDFKSFDGKTEDLKANPNTALALDGVKISGGGQSLSGLTGLTGKTNTEDKYYMKPASTSEKANEGDIDILKISTIEVKYKVTADVEGKIHVYRSRDNSDWMEICTLNKNAGANGLYGEALALDQRTKVITNLCTVLTRNSGSDKTAAWSKSDGKWYNEAFDGICYTRRETSFELGYKTPNQRSAALDPALCPPNSGQSDLFTKAFLSQFFMNDKSDAYPSKPDGFIGSFKGLDVKLAGYKEMFKTIPFAIPNVNVQDLN